MAISLARPARESLAMPIVQAFISDAGGDESALQTSKEHRFQWCCLYGKGFFILGKEKKER